MQSDSRTHLDPEEASLKYSLSINGSAHEILVPSHCLSMKAQMSLQCADSPELSLLTQSMDVNKSNKMDKD